MKNIYCFFILMAFSQTIKSQSQLLGGNAFLQGDHIEIGVNQCGSFGTTNNAPSGFHARSGTYPSPTTNALNLGFVADTDKDGWTVGTPRYHGDYFLPFTPRVGWGVSFNGVHYRVERTGSSESNCITLSPAAPPFPGNITSVVSNAQQSVATWQGNSNGLDIQKIITVKRSALYFTVKLKIKNTSGAPLNNIYYGEYINPDIDAFINDATAGGIANTMNTIVNQAATDNQSLVQAVGFVVKNYMGIGSKDCRSKVFRSILDYYGPADTNVESWHTGTNTSIVSTGADANARDFNRIIGITFNAGNLAPGDSTSFLFTYILNQADFNEALASTAPGFSVNDINYNSNDTAIVCTNSNVPVTLTNSEDYVWNWLPATGVTPSTGTNVSIAVGSTPVQYIAVGIGPCGTVRDTINLIPRNSRLYVDSSIVSSGDGSSWTSPLKTVTEALNYANSLNCVNEIWVKRGTYFPMRNATTVATSRDSSFRILRDGIKLYGGFAGTETLLTQRISGINTTILSADIGIRGDMNDNSNHVLTIFNAFNTSPITNNTRVDGFTIRDGSANPFPGSFSYNSIIIPKDIGGGILNVASSPYVSNCIISNNRAVYAGGGIFSTRGKCLFDHVEVINNQMIAAPSAGAGIDLYQDSSIVTNSVIRGNISNSIGAGISSRASRAIFKNIIVDSNRAAIAGGFYLADNGADSLINVTIRGNRGTVQNGAVENANSTIFINGLITGNTAPSNAGWVNRGSGSSQLTNITIAGNRATSNYAGIAMTSGTVTAKNCVVWSNYATNEPNIFVAPAAILNVSNSNIEAATVYPGAGNINSNPVFIAPMPAPIVTAPTTLGNYRLDPCQSLSVDAGDNSAISIATDIEGANRIQNSLVDMGAYETAASLSDVSITSNPTMATAICSGSSITFTATPINAGPNTPGYQWLVNGTVIPTAATAVYTTTSLSHNDIIQVVMIPDNGCVPRPDTSNSIVLNMTNTVTPTVSITASQANICAGTSVTFTAAAINAGATPLYQWKINGADAGTNSSTFTSTTLANNDVVTVTLTSSESCVTINNIISNNITMQVSNNVNATVSITASTVNICAGTAVNFTATATNGGNNPVYQWQINGINVGTNSNTFSSNTLNNNDEVTIILTSNAACVSNATVNSNLLRITVGDNITPTVAIVASQNNICPGTPVTFAATATGQGTAPVYQWQINGNNAGTNSSSFTTSILNNNDAVTVILTSNEGCLANNNIVSNVVTMQLTPRVTPTVTITASQQIICAGTNVVFTATATNGGANPIYQWKLNSNNIGNNSNSFSSASLNNNDVITVVLTSDADCLASNNVNSNSISITVNAVVTPAVKISVNKNILCDGEVATFTATPVNAGSNPTYQWKINGVNAGNNSAQFTHAAFTNNDMVTVVLTSNAACTTVNNVESNSIRITVANDPVLNITADNLEILEGGSTMLHATSTEPINSYQWTPASLLSNFNTANPVASPLQLTTFTLNATSVAGCKATASIEIKVVKGPLIANTFSPNGDGINELWLIKNLETYPNCRLQVFTRTGQLLFESRGYRQPWNGTFKGKSLPVDTYYYILELNNRIGSKPITGYVTIIK